MRQQLLNAARTYFISNIEKHRMNVEGRSHA